MHLFFLFLCVTQNGSRLQGCARRSKSRHMPRMPRQTYLLATYAQADTRLLTRTHTHIHTCIQTRTHARAHTHSHPFSLLRSLLRCLSRSLSLSLSLSLHLSTHRFSCAVVMPCRRGVVGALAGWTQTLFALYASPFACL